jgi:hypothetical protein
MANRVTWRDGVRMVEPAPVPQSVTRMQGRIALQAAGLLSQVEAIIVQADTVDRIAWEDATEWPRDSRMIAQIGTALDLSSAEIDDLFRAAMAVQI